MNRLVFLDESGAKTNLTRLRGRALRGERVYDTTPHGHWCTTTMISSIRSNGSTACLVIDGATDQDVFQEYVRRVLVPTLRAGDCVIMDNLAPHKAPGVQALVNAAGATVRWLPAYSPDLNPIEKMWSKVKELLRSARARTQDTLVSAIGEALKSVTADDALHWFASCGYTIT